MHLIHIAQNSANTDERFSPRLAVLLDNEIAFVSNPADPEAQVNIFTTPLASLREWCAHASENGERVPLGDVETVPAPPRIIWAAGLTFTRREEASAGNADFNKIYKAARPEIFLKSATVHASHGETITVRSDSASSVPEGELTLVINNQQEVVAYVVGNDVSSRSMLGESLLYLAQAKIWDGSASLGTVFRLATDDIDPETLDIDLSITRNDNIIFEDTCNTNQLNRPIAELVDWLHRGQNFPIGAYFMTGTGIELPDGFTLEAGDDVAITIEQVGQLRNSVAVIDVETNTLRY